MKQTLRVPIYEVFLKSKTKNRIGPDHPRDFGGVIPGVMEYTFDTCPVPAKTDKQALQMAERKAQERDMFILKITKILYLDMYPDVD